LIKKYNQQFIIPNELLGKCYTENYRWKRKFSNDNKTTVIIGIKKHKLRINIVVNKTKTIFTII